MTVFEGRIRSLAVEFYRQAVATVEDEHHHALRAEYDRGFADGYDLGMADSANRSLTDLDLDFLRELRALVHPDLHPTRAARATRACQRLNAVLDEERAAA